MEGCYSMLVSHLKAWTILHGHRPQTSDCLSFLICIMGMIIIPKAQDLGKSTWSLVCEMFAMVSGFSEWCLSMGYTSTNKDENKKLSPLSGLAPPVCLPVQIHLWLSWLLCYAARCSSHSWVNQCLGTGFLSFKALCLGCPLNQHVSLLQDSPMGAFSTRFSRTCALASLLPHFCPSLS